MPNPFKRFFRKPISFPLGRNIPADPADHADDFSHRYADRLDWLASIRLSGMRIVADEFCPARPSFIGKSKARFRSAYEARHSEHDPSALRF
jgi:hypothetical protein